MATAGTLNILVQTQHAQAVAGLQQVQHHVQQTSQHVHELGQSHGIEALGEKLEHVGLHALGLNRHLIGLVTHFGPLGIASAGLFYLWEKGKEQAEEIAKEWEKIEKHIEDVGKETEKLEVHNKQFNMTEYEKGIDNIKRELAEITKEQLKANENIPWYFSKDRKVVMEVGDPEYNKEFDKRKKQLEEQQKLEKEKKEAESKAKEQAEAARKQEQAALEQRHKKEQEHLRDIEQANRLRKDALSAEDKYREALAEINRLEAMGLDVGNAKKKLQDELNRPAREAAEKEAKAVEDRAKAIVKESLSKKEKLALDLKEIELLHLAGKLTLEEAVKAQKARIERDEEKEKVEKEKHHREGQLFAGATRFGSDEARSSILRGVFGGSSNQVADNTKKTVEELKKLNRKKPDVKVVAVNVG